MSGYALLLAPPAQPQVVPDPPARVAALRHEPGDYQFALLDWSPTPERVLGVHGHTGEDGVPGNRAARALTGAVAFHGPVLVTGHRTSGELTTLTEFDLIVIGTRLLIGELSDRAIAG